MRVIQAKSAGFCYGVERAVRLAEQTAREKGGCVMLGSIIHNAHVVRELEQLGGRCVNSVEEIRPGDTVIIRSHGERKEVFDRLAEVGIQCVWTPPVPTCSAFSSWWRRRTGRAVLPSSSARSTIRRSSAWPAGPGGQ